MMVLFVLLLLFAVSDTYGRSLGTCGRQCLFRLCKPDDAASILPHGADIILRAPGVAGYPYICRKFSDTRLLSSVTEPGEAEVQTGSISKPISGWRPSGLRSRFKKNFFKVNKIPLSQKLYRPLQSISRTEKAGNQDEILDGQCVILPILKYKVIDTKERKISKRKWKTQQDCVAFTVRSSKLIVDVTWSFAANLDLIVTGPSDATGVSINGERGLKVSPKPRGRCVGGQESVVFRRALPGIYTVMLKNSGGSGRRKGNVERFGEQAVVGDENCSTGYPGTLRRMMKFPSQITVRPRFELTATLNGRVIFKERGKHNPGKQQNLKKLTFTVPPNIA